MTQINVHIDTHTKLFLAEGFFFFLLHNNLRWQGNPKPVNALQRTFLHLKKKKKNAQRFFPGTNGSKTVTKGHIWQIEKHHFNWWLNIFPVNLKSGFYFYTHFNLIFFHLKPKGPGILFGWIWLHLKLYFYFNTLHFRHPWKCHIRGQQAPVSRERYCWQSMQGCSGFA